MPGVNWVSSVFPYFDTTHWHIGRLSIHPFLILVVLGCMTGYLITVQRGKRYGISQERISEFALWLFGGGFICARLAYTTYAPATLFAAAHAPTRLVFAGGYLPSADLPEEFLERRHFSWFAGSSGLSGSMIRDAVFFSTPFGWSIARVGCYLMHDHPGVRTSSWLGVRYPGGTRYDLGLLEILFLLGLGGAFLLLDRKPRPPGFFAAAFLIPYGFFRLLQDQLHVDEAEVLRLDRRSDRGYGHDRVCLGLPCEHLPVYDIRMASLRNVAGWLLRHRFTVAFCAAAIGPLVFGTLPRITAPRGLFHPHSVTCGGLPQNRL